MAYTDEGKVAEALGQSEAFVGFQERLSRAARVNRPVLFLGERGTGKELAATRLHFLSARWNAPLITLNCAALAPSLVESELFGHEPGAFTGAVGRRTGRFEAADLGTLFLDEIGNIPMEAQEKILRAVEYGVFERLGGSEPVHADVRIVAATNADLRAAVSRGAFKADLLDRLCFDVLILPPLRKREGDILLLANHFASRMALELERRDVIEFADEAIDALERYAWPGNVRELKNIVERAVYRAEGECIGLVDLVFDPFEGWQGQAPAGARPPHRPTPDRAGTGEQPDAFRRNLLRLPYKTAVREVELLKLRHALDAARFSQRRAAEQLGLTYHQFRGQYRKYAAELGGGEVA